MLKYTWIKIVNT